LWAGGYKLSLYHRHPAPSSQVTVAKLWFESRRVFLEAASKLKVKSHFVPGAPAFSIPVQRLPRLGRDIASVPPVRSRNVAYFDFLIPFRSPPPHRFCLA